MSLTRWQPFQELATFREAVDRLFDDDFFRPLWIRESERSLPLDIVEHDNEFIVHASLPGFDPKNIEVNVQGDILTLSGTMEEEQETKKEHYYLRERRSGSVKRSVRLPVGVDADKATATYENGVLTLHLPKLESATIRRIKVKS